MITVACGKCGVEFNTTPSRLRKSRSGVAYCSRDCGYSRNLPTGKTRPGQIVTFTCLNCGIQFDAPSHQRQRARTFCGTSCYHTYNSGPNHHDWTGGEWVGKTGYRMVYNGVGRRKKEHIMIAEWALGRKLKRGEVVHHINLDKTDNRHSNLLICDTSYHAWLHHEMGRRWAMEHLK